MGIITGYICLFLILFLFAKYITKRCHLTKINTFLMRIHKYAACGFLVVGIAHFILVIKVIDTRNIIVVISGIVILVMGIVLTSVCHLMKNREKEIIFHRFFSLVIAIMMITHVVSYFVDYSSYRTAINDIMIDEVDLSTIENGEYIGECDTGYIYAKVKVTVYNHAITDIELLEHNHERGAKAESIVKTVINEQRVHVDAVSGATNSSMVIEKACVNALTKH
ncbi:MAG: FMN-binding protein [Coprococcus sp.]